MFNRSNPSVYNANLNWILTVNEFAPDGTVNTAKLADSITHKILMEFPYDIVGGIDVRHIPAGKYRLDVKDSRYKYNVKVAHEDSERHIYNDPLYDGPTVYLNNTYALQSSLELKIPNNNHTIDHIMYDDVIYTPTISATNLGLCTSTGDINDDYNLSGDSFYIDLNTSYIKCICKYTLNHKSTIERVWTVEKPIEDELVSQTKIFANVCSNISFRFTALSNQM